MILSSRPKGVASSDRAEPFVDLAAMGDTQNTHAERVRIDFEEDSVDAGAELIDRVAGRGKASGRGREWVRL